MVGMNILTPVLPVYILTLGMSGTMLGIINSSYFLAFSIGSPLAGLLGDRIGYKILIVIGLGVQAGVSLAYLATREPWALIVLRFLQGLLSSMVVTPSMAWAGALSKTDSEASSMGIFNAFCFVGIGIGPAIGGLASKNADFVMPFMIMSAILFVSFLLCLALPGLEGGRPIEKKKTSTTGAFRLLTSNLILGLFISSFILTLGEGGMASFLPVLTIKNNMTQPQTGLLASIFALTAGLFLAPCGYIANRINKTLMIISGLLIVGAGIGVLPFCTTFLSFTLLGIISGIGIAMIMPSSSALLIVHTRETGLGLAVGLFTIANMLGFVVGPVICGKVMDRYGLNYVFYFTSGLFILAIFILTLFLIVLPRLSGNSLRQKNTY